MTAFLAFKRGICEARSSKCQSSDTLPESHIVISLDVDREVSQVHASTPVSSALELPFDLLQHGSRGCFVQLALWPVVELLQAWLPKLRGKKTGYKARLAICRELGRSFRAKHLATQLLSGLNPKRGAAIPVHQAPAPKTRLRPLALGSVDSAVKTRHNWERKLWLRWLSLQTPTRA